jgi:RND superfamily putative drug exporter
MTRIIELAVSRPRTVLAVWLVLAVALGAAGTGIEGELRLVHSVVSGSPSARAESEATRQFGQESTFVALLEGPPTSLRLEGRRTVAALARIPHVSVVSPWQPGGPAALRPNGHTAIVVMGVHTSFERAGNHVAPLIRATLARVAPPISHHLVGYPEITAAISRAAFTGLARAELIAAILLGILLLVVFRSPVAAGVPLLLGLCTVACVRGVLAGLNATVLPLDVTALSLASMFGLALGVDYSLLMVSRFREQLAEGEPPRAAARTVARTAGHTVWVAGGALAVALLALYLIAPEDVTASGSLGGLAAVVVSIIGAQLALPPLLALLGHNVNRWSFAGGGSGPSRLGALAWRAVTRPLHYAVPALLVLLALCSQSAFLKLSPPHDSSLPQGGAVRADVHAIDRSLGSGWATPYEVVIAARHGLITDPRTLYAMASWQAHLERNRAVAAVVGPQTVYGGEGPPHASGSYASQAQMGLELLRDAPPEGRQALNLAINLGRGGTALRMFVIERTGHGESLAGNRAALPGDPLRDLLKRDAASLERTTDTRIMVGGPAATLQDFTASDQSLIPVLVALLAAITFVILVLWMGAVPIALAAVALNVVTVSASVGVLVLCFQRPGLLAAPDDLGAAVIPGVVAVSFALAIDYEVFLLARVREGIALTGDADRALRYALDRTARVITGAALIMCGVFVAFATSGLADLREYGVGLAVAVTIDATIVRLVLLPSMIRLLGPRGWWAPAWLRRTLDLARAVLGPADAAGAAAEVRVPTSAAMPNPSAQNVSVNQDAVGLGSTATSTQRRTP